MMGKIAISNEWHAIDNYPHKFKAIVPAYVHNVLEASSFDSKAYSAFVFTCIKVVSVAIVLSASLIFFSCTNVTEDNFGSMSGRVILVNDTENSSYDTEDFSGVSVSLYSASFLDTTIVRINALFPNVGVQINQETEFDPRKSIPLQQTLTNADGSFSFAELPLGVYNIVLGSEMWGYAYRYNIVIDDNKAKKGQIDDVLLYPHIEINSPSYDSFTFEADHCYSFYTDAFFSGNVMIEGGALIRIDSGVKLSFGADIAKSGDGYARIQSLQTENNTAVYKWDSIEILSSGNSLNEMILSDSNSGVIFTGLNNSLSNSVIRHSNNGSFILGYGSRVTQCLLVDISSKAFAMNNSPAQAEMNFFIDHNVVKNTDIGIRTMGNAVAITDNYFIDNTSAIFSNKNLHQIMHNNFDRNDRAIVCAGSEIPIEYNNFYSSNNRSISFSYEYYSNISNPIIRQNNFYQNTGYVISLYPGTTVCDIDASSNYWLGQDIDNLLWDYFDADILVHTVIYMPKLAAVASAAGIRN